MAKDFKTMEEAKEWAKNQPNPYEYIGHLIEQGNLSEGFQELDKVFQLMFEKSGQSLAQCLKLEAIGCNPGVYLDILPGRYGFHVIGEDEYGKLWGTAIDFKKENVDEELTANCLKIVDMFREKYQ